GPTPGAGLGDIFSPVPSRNSPHEPQNESASLLWKPQLPDDHDATTSTLCTTCAGLAADTTASTALTDTAAGSATETRTARRGWSWPGNWAPGVTDHATPPLSATRTRPPVRTSRLSRRPETVPRMRYIWAA